CSQSGSETEKEEKSNADWDKLFDFNIDDIPLLGTSSSAGGHLTQEEATKEAIAIRMSRKFALLEEERPIIETMAYHDKFKKILDEVWKDKVELDGKNVKEEEEALGINDMKKVYRGITMINHTQAEAMEILTNVLCQVGVTKLIAKFLILDILIDHDSPIVVGRGFLRTIGSITMGTHDDEAESSRSKCPRQHETVEEVLLPQVHHEFLLCEGCSRDAKSRYNTKLA
ncbi:hypothetical protein Tco_0830668, partial [Tanacetum coccineum]